jgi:hypothetical protein
MIFYRIFDNKLYQDGNVERLGFDKVSPIPKHEWENFIIFRTCHGIGDWGIVSAMPRLIKQKYPNAVVVYPGKKLLTSLFPSHPWGNWDNPFDNPEIIFRNNPYVNGYVESIPGEVLHDHFRVYNSDNPYIPLTEQMLKIYGFTDEEIQDSCPELYFSDHEEIERISVTKGLSYGCLLIPNKPEEINANREEYFSKILGVIEKYNLPLYYYSSIPLNETPFEKYCTLGDLSKLGDIRLQTNIRCKAVFNVGFISGVMDIASRYSKVYSVPIPSLEDIAGNGNFIKCETYL